jgi:hypothetical protein
MELKMDQDGFKPANSVEWQTCGRLREIEANANLVV